MMGRVLMMMVALIWGSMVLAADGEVVDIAIKGMSCPFCVYSVEKKLSALEGVQSAEVDLEQGRARVAMQPGVAPDSGQLREAIINAGFTPGDISAVSDGGE